MLGASSSACNIFRKAMHTCMTCSTSGWVSFNFNSFLELVSPVTMYFQIVLHLTFVHTSFCSPSALLCRLTSSRNFLYRQTRGDIHLCMRRDCSFTLSFFATVPGVILLALLIRAISLATFIALFWSVFSTVWTPPERVLYTLREVTPSVFAISPIVSPSSLRQRAA